MRTQTLCEIGHTPAFAAIGGPFEIAAIDAECHIKKNNSPYTVGLLYSWTCPNFKGSKCYTNADRLELARITAFGALLHQLQDSYSQAHAARLSDGRDPSFATGPFQPRVVRRPITVFYDYGSQNDSRRDANGEVLKDPHSLADSIPVLDDSCSGTTLVPDVLTASALMIRMVERARSAADQNDDVMRDQLEERAMLYLADHVYPLTQHT